MISTHWGATLILGDQPDRQVIQFTEEDNLLLTEPLAVNELKFQPTPTPPWQTGKTWNISLGRRQNGDLLALQISVPENQFITAPGKDLPSQPWMLEAIGASATGYFLGHPIAFARLTAAESTREFIRHFLPLIAK